jgi:hypothetical protein
MNTAEVFGQFFDPKQGRRHLFRLSLIRFDHRWWGPETESFSSGIGVYAVPAGL